jgi:hypothetical protein
MGWATLWALFFTNSSGHTGRTCTSVLGLPELSTCNDNGTKTLKPKLFYNLKRHFLFHSFLLLPTMPPQDHHKVT